MKKKLKVQNNKAFSLIELLIVIAIIGILSTIILTSLSKSQANAQDSKIKQQLTSFRTAAEIYFNNQEPNNSYGPATDRCDQGLFNDFGKENGTPGIFIAVGNLPDFVQLACKSTDLTYILKASLYYGTDYWCIDSKGASRLISGAVDDSPADAFCP
jgi:prepilin-type N-terminal cleavage/methylation domain-containing protein